MLSVSVKRMVLRRHWIHSQTRAREGWGVFLAHCKELKFLSTKPPLAREGCSACEAVSLTRWCNGWLLPCSPLSHGAKTRGAHRCSHISVKGGCWPPNRIPTCLLASIGYSHYCYRHSHPPTSEPNVCNYLRSYSSEAIGSFLRNTGPGLQKDLNIALRLSTPAAASLQAALCRALGSRPPPVRHVRAPREPPKPRHCQNAERCVRAYDQAWKPARCDSVRFLKASQTPIPSFLILSLMLLM